MLTCGLHGAAADAPPPVETKFPTHGSLAGSGLTFTPDGTAVVYYDGDGIATWDIAQRKTVSTIPTEDRRFMLSHDGTRIANEAKQSIRLYDAKTGKLLHELTAPPTNTKPADPNGPFFRSLGFGEESKQFFTANPDDVQVWDVASGKMLGRIAPKKGRPGNAPGVQSYDGRWLSVAYPGSGSPQVLDTRTGFFAALDYKAYVDLIPAKGRDIAFTALGSWSFAGDGQTVYATDQMNDLIVGWSVPRGRLRSHVTIPGLVFALVSRDGSRILARYRGPDDRILRVLDSKTLDVVATIGPLEKVVSWYAISPDSRYVVATAGGSPGIWDLSPEKPTSRPAGRARRR